MRECTALMGSCGGDANQVAFPGLEGVVESVADLKEGVVDVGGEGVHPGSGGERDQSDNQGILDQILTVLLQDDVLDP